MEKIFIRADLFLAGALFVALASFSIGIAHAATCTPPTPPVCYQNVPIYPNTGFQSDGAIVSSDGQTVVLPNGNGNAVPNSKQVQVDCTDDPTYQGELLSYNECLQLNSMNQSSAALQSYLDSPTHQQTNAPTQDYTQVCPYPAQPSSQASQAVIDTVDGDGGTVKKYADGTYALFDVLGRYEWPATESEFNIFTKAETDLTAIQEIGLGTYPQQPADSSSLMEVFSMDLDSQESSIHQMQSPINSWLADSSNCPNATHQQIAVTGVTLNESSNTLTVGGATDPLMVTIFPDHVPDQATNQNITWSSSDPGVASVHYGVVTAVAPGSATITVTTADGNFTATDNITVVDPTSDATTATNDSLVAQMKAYLATQGYKPPTSASTSSWHSQIKSRFDATTTSVAAATNTGSVASSTVAPVPKQKHWYEWLNPFNWFSWLH